MALNAVEIDTSQFRLIPHTSEDLQYGSSQAKTTVFDGSEHRLSDTEMRQVHNILTHWSGSGGLDEVTALDNFNRFYSIFPDMEMPNDLKSYVFFTRPELNVIDRSGNTSYSGKKGGLGLVNRNSQDNRLQHMAMLYPEMLQMLTKDYSEVHDFIPYLQGRTESLQIPDYNIRTMDFSIPFFNYKFTYPTVTNESLTGGTFEATFREDADLRITNMMQFWVYYMDAVMKGIMFPSDYHIHHNYYDFMCSVYEFVCDPTSERILYFAKYTGCYPTGVPTSNFSHNIRSNVENRVSVTFNYIKVEHMEPRILKDFNSNSRPTGNRMPIYDDYFGVTGQSLVGAPKVEWNSQKNALFLRWYERGRNPSADLPSALSTYNSIEMSSRNILQAKNSVRATAYGNGNVTKISAARSGQSATGSLSRYLLSNTTAIK